MSKQKKTGDGSTFITQQEVITPKISEFKRPIRNGQFSTTAVKKTPPPYILISRQAELDVATLVEHYSTEITWFGVTKLVKGKFGDILYLDKIFVPAQTVSMATVKVDADKMGEMVNEIQKYYGQNTSFNLWGHSHVNMGVNPSSVDESEFKYWYDLEHDMPMNGTIPPYFIMWIQNKSGQYTCDLVWEGVRYSSFPVKLERDIFEYNTELLESLNGKIKVQQPVQYNNKKGDKHNTTYIYNGRNNKDDTDFLYDDEFDGYYYDSWYGSYSQPKETSILRYVEFYELCYSSYEELCDIDKEALKAHYTELNSLNEEPCDYFVKLELLHDYISDCEYSNGDSAIFIEEIAIQDGIISRKGQEIPKRKGINTFQFYIDNPNYVDSFDGGVDGQNSNQIA